MRLFALMVFAALALPATAKEPYQKVVEVFSGNMTVAEEPLVFPVDQPGVKALVITMAPGEATGWHRHGTPLFGYILEGELTVTYEGIGDRIYGQGTGFLEAMKVTHRGTNTDAGLTRILAIFFTGEGKSLTTVPEQME